MKCEFVSTGKVGFGETPLCVCKRVGCPNFGYAFDTALLRAECLHPTVLPGTLLARLIKIVSFGMVKECEACRRRERWLNAHLGFPVPGWIVRVVGRARQ